MGIQRQTHLTRAAAWSDSNCTITYFDSRDMQKYGFLPDKENEFIEWYCARLKQTPFFSSLSYTVINVSDIPEQREHRDCWSLAGGKVEVSPSKLQQKQNKAQEETAILAKMGVTREELNRVLKKA